MTIRILRLRSTFARPADATAYAAGDEVSNSATAGSVVRATFDLTGFSRGRILQAGIDITPASGSFVVTASDMELLIFKTPDVSAVVGDNVTDPIVASTRCKAIGHYRFDDGAWLNPLAALTAGASAFQQVAATNVVGLATPTLQSPTIHGFTFQGQTLAQRELTAVLHTLAAWTPGAVVNTIGITLDLEVE